MTQKKVKPKATLEQAKLISQIPPEKRTKDEWGKNENTNS